MNKKVILALALITTTSQYSSSKLNSNRNIEAAAYGAIAGLIVGAVAAIIKPPFNINFNKIDFIGEKELVGIGSEKEKLTAQNTAFMFDMHGVVLKFDSKQCLPDFWNNLNKADFALRAYRYFFANPPKKLKVQGKGKQSIEYFMLDDNEEVENSFIKQICPHKPINGTVGIMKKLNGNGFNLFGCSNLGVKSLEQMSKRFPATFGIFTDFMATGRNGDYSKKSDNNVQIYQNTVDIIKRHNPAVKYIIFIDNEQCNLDVAEQIDDIYGIHFTSPDQLRAKLELLNLL